KRRPTRWILAVLLTWCSIIASACVVVSTGLWYLYPVAIAFIATRQHALGVLMHDAAHLLVFANRRANFVCADLLCALPLGISTATYHHQHIKHHRFVNTSGDPDIRIVQGDTDWEWPKTPRACAEVLVRDCSGLNAKMIFIQLKRWSLWPAIF